MNLINKGIDYIKKICDNDDVCLMLVFVVIGLMLCFLFKNRISGYINFAPIEHEFAPLVPVKSVINAQAQQPSGCGQQMRGQQMRGQQMGGQQMRGQQMRGQQMRGQPMGGQKNGRQVGIELKARKPEPTPSTMKQLQVMKGKPAVKGVNKQQMPGLQIQDATIFKPFDEIWNPGFMPLDMVFKGPSAQMAADRPMKEVAPMPPKVPMPPKAPMPPRAPMPSKGKVGANEVNLVLVYAPWCGYSKKMIPDYEKVKAEFDGKTINGKKINIIMYNSDVDKAKVKEYQVKGFPTLFFESNGKRETFPHREYSKIKAFLESL